MIFAVISTFFAVSAFSQTPTKTVKGKVTDDSTGSFLPYANVSLVGTTKKTQTDSLGNFSIQIPDDGKPYSLKVGYTGYVDKTVTVTGNSVVIKLANDGSNNPNEVVVQTGYYTVKKKELMASVSSVSAKDLKDIPINSAAEALNGRLAGVTATTAEGSPDANITIRVRGGGSITQDNSPLYIVDGVQVENALNTIVMQDIQSIDVLKDAAAISIYGARGANGVIVITTKSGKPGKMKVTYNGFYGTKKITKKLDVMDPYNFVLYEYERSRGDATDSASFAKSFGSYFDTLSVYKNMPMVDWQDQIMGRTGNTQMHNVSASGGNKNTSYVFGYTHNDDNAIIRNSAFRRDQFTLKIDQKITKKIKLSVSGRYFNQNVYGAGTSDDKTSYSRLRNTVKYRPYLSPGQDLDDADDFADPNAGNSLSLVNPIQLNNQEYSKKTTNNYNVTASLSYNNIIKNLSFKSTVGYNKQDYVVRMFSDTVTSTAKLQGGGNPVVQLDTTLTTSLNNNNVFTYSLKNLHNKHDIDLLVGEETNQTVTESHKNFFINYPKGIGHDDAFDNTSMATPQAGYPAYIKAKATYLSFFGRASYSYLKKYMVAFTFRADGASKFAEDLRWGYFPSASIGWNIKNEKFMQNADFFSSLKLRGTIGTVGNSRMEDYLFITTFGTQTRNPANGNLVPGYYGLNNVLVPGYYSQSLVNSALKWETTVNRNIGLDMTILKNRLDVSIEYYNNSTKDLLLDVPIANTYGYSTQLQNIGKTSNKGVEIQLSATVIRDTKHNFNWNANFNMSFNKNRVEALGTNQTAFFPQSSWLSSNPNDYIVRVGDPVGSMWGLVSDGMYTVSDFNYNASNGIYTLKPGVVSDVSIVNGPVQPGSAKYKDLNGDGVVDIKNDMTVIGNPTPKFTGGLNQQFTYKNWDASVFINFSYGATIYNANKIEFTNGYTKRSNILAMMNNRWKTIDAAGNVIQRANSTQVWGIAPDQLAAVNVNAQLPQPLRGAGGFYPSSWAMEDGSFLRVNNITLGYTLPVRTLAKMGINKLRVYGTVNNLAVLAGYSGYDPEVSVRKSGLTPNLDYSAYPKSRSFIFGVNVSF